MMDEHTSMHRTLTHTAHTHTRTPIAKIVLYVRTGVNLGEASASACGLMQRRSAANRKGSLTMMDWASLPPVEVAWRAAKS